MNVRNCLKFYKIADEIDAEVLRKNCTQLMGEHWVGHVHVERRNATNRFDLQRNFQSNDFQSLSAPMAYKLFKEMTPFSLHQAIRMRREDVLFLYLIDHDADVRQTKCKFHIDLFTFTSSWKRASIPSMIKVK
jgi:rabankyrin-5